MIYAKDLNEYDHIVFYGCVKNKIDVYLEHLDKLKCVITDSDYRMFGKNYRDIEIRDFQKILNEKKGKMAVVVLALNAESSIYGFIRRFGFQGDVYFNDMICFSDDLGDCSYEKNGTYTIEKHTQILIALLKQYEIRNIIVSPGICNMNFVYSVQRDDYFHLYSCLDERSAAYMACGMAQTTGEPVVLSCTGATASRNYMSGLTEAYYSKLPILAITSSRDSFMIGNGVDQITDRAHLPADIAVFHTEITDVSDEREKDYCKLQINRALCKLFLNKGGPVHINLITRFSKDFSTKTLPECKRIRLVNVTDELPPIPNDSVMLLKPNIRMDIETKSLLEQFSIKYGVTIIGDHLSGYNGKNFVNISLLADQRNKDLFSFENIIIAGEVNRSNSLKCKKSWRISDDANIEDYYLNLEYHFNMSLKAFLLNYAEKREPANARPNKVYGILDELCSKLKCSVPELPYSNLWIAKNTSHLLPDNSILYMGIYSSLKNWNYFDISETVSCFSTVGGFGIDGTLSAMIGSSILNAEKIHFAVLGDLAFYYDMNALGNRHIKGNVRIMVMNNGGGNSLIVNNGLPDVNDMPLFVSATGHFSGDGSTNVIRKYVEGLGFKYLFAESKEGYLSQLPFFLDDKSEVPIIFEIKYPYYNDIDAVKAITEIAN